MRRARRPLEVGRGPGVNLFGQRQAAAAGLSQPDDLFQPGGAGGFEMEAGLEAREPAADAAVNGKLVAARVDAELESGRQAVTAVSIIGYYMMRTGGYSSWSSNRDEKRSGSQYMLIGLALFVLGYLGVLLGKIIKSAISRQREFLADASAVQFTRYPAGIGGALKKIGGLAAGSRIRNVHAEEASHMFFGNGLADSFLNLFATHPPLVERIRRLEPDFDGSFPKISPLAVAGMNRRSDSPSLVPTSVGTGEFSAALALDSGTVQTRTVAGSENTVDAEPLEYVGRMVAGMPPSLVQAAREPSAARAVIFALLLSRDDDAMRSRQMHEIKARVEPALFAQTQQLTAQIAGLSPEKRLPLASLTFPAFKRFSLPQYTRFCSTIKAIVAAEGKTDLFTYCLQVMLSGCLDVHFGLKKPPAIRYRTLASVARPAAMVLSSLTYSGQSRPEDIESAFRAGIQGRFPQASLVPRPQCTLSAFDAALGELSQSSPLVQQELIAATVACIAADGKTTLEESELLRAIAAALGCPVPPVVGDVAG